MVLGRPRSDRVMRRPAIAVRTRPRPPFGHSLGAANSAVRGRLQRLAST